MSTDQSTLAHRSAARRLGRAASLAIGFVAALSFVVGIGAQTASADTGAAASTTGSNSTRLDHVSCNNWVEAPVVRTIRGIRYLEARAGVDCTGPVGSLSVKLYGCRQGRACQGPYTHQVSNASSVQVIKRWPCESRVPANFATVAYTYGNGVLMTKLRGPGRGWVALGCS